MNNSAYRYTYGPVPSWRLGRSLGVDIIPHKICSYDCVYCQIGHTTKKSASRDSFVPVDAVLAEIRQQVHAESPPDIITFSGSGEPTLNRNIGDMIAGIKQMTEIPVAVLTNSSLLWLADVQEALFQADLVMPSLDAGDENMFRWVNRPHRDIAFDKMVGGLIDFGRQFSGKYWLEIMLLAGITGIDAEVKKIAALVERIDPDRVELNTVSRTPASDFAMPVPVEHLREFAKFFKVPVDIRTADQKIPSSVGRENDKSAADILSLLQRRPCSLADIATGLDMHITQAGKILTPLIEQGSVKVDRSGTQPLYAAVHSKTTKSKEHQR